MSLDEAIETIKTMKYICRTLFPSEEQAALSLGIEALNLEIQTRQEYPDVDWPLLPGETKE